MSYRAAALGFALSASIALSVPLCAQNDLRRGDLLGNMDPSVSRGSSTNPSTSAMMDYGSIAGTVSTSDHHPAGDARIQVQNIATGTLAATGYASPSGSFRVKNLPAGSYEVVATSGISETREQVQVEGIETTVNLTIPHTTTTDSNGDKTVSVSQLQVPEKARNELKKAREALDKNKNADARKRIDKALAIDPTYADALVLRGVMALQDNDLGAASKDFDKAIEFDSSAVMAYVGTGAIYNMQGRYDDALRELDRGVAIDPTSWQAQFEIARANLGKGDFEAALKFAAKTQELAPVDFAPIHLVKGRALLGMKDYSSAVSEFEAFLSKDSQSPDAAAVRRQLEEAKAFVTTGTGGK